MNSGSTTMQTLPLSIPRPDRFQVAHFQVARPARILSLLALPLFGAILSGLARAEDAVILADGKRVRGSLVSLSPDTVEIENRDGTQNFVISEVQQVVFDGEPEGLGSARGLLLRRDPKSAADELTKIEAADLQAADPRIREEYAYLKLAVAASAASAADGAAEAEAFKTYLARNTRSHHFYEGQEILGNLLARLGEFDKATAAFSELDRGPPALRVRSAARKARLLLQQGNPAAAIKEFDVAAKITTDPDDASSSAQKGEAQLGKARCLAQTGRANEGIVVAKAAIKSADPGDRDLLAMAFAALGECQRAAGGKDEDALISFLTVDLVYNTVAEQRAEALFNLAELWDASKQPERAREARQILTSSYPESPWAKKLGAGGKAS